MSPVVIGSFAALDAAFLAQLGYALRDLQARHARESRETGDDSGEHAD